MLKHKQKNSLIIEKENNSQISNKNNYRVCRKCKNHIETNYLVVDQIRRDKLIKVLNEKYKMNFF